MGATQLVLVGGLPAALPLGPAVLSTVGFNRWNEAKEARVCAWDVAG